MRHLQAESGVDPGLTAEGKRQAQILARWFGKAERPRTIYVSRFRRAQETAAPLAMSLDIAATVYDPSDSSGLVERIRAGQGNILVVGHSNTVPEIIERLGGARPAPIEHDQHGDIWRVAARSGKTDKLRLEPR